MTVYHLVYLQNVPRSVWPELTQGRPRQALTSLAFSAHLTPDITSQRSAPPLLLLNLHTPIPALRSTPSVHTVLSTLRVHRNYLSVLYQPPPYSQPPVHRLSLHRKTSSTYIVSNQGLSPTPAWPHISVEIGSICDHRVYSRHNSRFSDHRAPTSVLLRFFLV